MRTLVSRSLVVLLASLSTATAQAADPAPAAGKAAALAPLNLAHKKPATASGAQAGHPASDAVDDDPSTRWCAPDNGTGYTWQVDLGKPEDLKGCQIAWEFDNRAYQYKIEGSADGKTWTLLSDQSKAEAGPQVRQHPFDAKGTRHVRLTVTGVPSGSWASFTEFEVFSTQLAAVTEKPKNVAPVAVGAGLLAGVKAPPGFDVTLFAAPPEVSYPVCLATSLTGEVFVGVDENGSLGAGPKRGRVLRCLDENNDGKADKINVFAEMDSPRGMVYDAGTLYVQHPPFVTAFRDTNGDGVSDKQDVLVSGIGFDLKFRGADHTTNGMQIGIDGWLYIAVGDYGFVKAIGSDKKEVQLLGGGVVRVRPDGSELEIVSRGQRNIYDVAIDPQMNLFTRDNTNDGGGWNVRLSHVVPGGHYGYPSLYINFPDEIVPALADYGGGSPTGALYLDEPGFPEGLGRALYTCDWGRSVIFRHPLAAQGATYTPQQVPFLELPRPTDMEVDGQSRLFVASWRNGGFNYDGPNIGYVARVVPGGAAAPVPPNLKTASDADLLKHLASPSHTIRLHTQHEMLRRGLKSEWASGLESLAAATDRPIEVRVAAIFTLKQLAGAKSAEALVRLAKIPEIREAALKALSDRASEADQTPSAPLFEALKDANPRVRMVAVAGLARLNKTEAAEALIPLTSDADPIVAHVAIGALVRLKAGDAALKALDAASPSQTASLLRVLAGLHDTAVVDGLLVRLGKTNDPALKQGLLKALCRLYFREAAWDGKWWGTRPDTTGPYYRRDTWAASEKILPVLKTALADSSQPAAQQALLVDLVKHRIDFDEVAPRVIELAAKDESVLGAAIDLVTGRPKWPAGASALLASAATSPERNVQLRQRALKALHAGSNQPDVFEAALAAFSTCRAEAKPPKELASAWDEFTRDGKHADRAAAFATAAGSTKPFEQELGYTVLLNLVANPLLNPAARDTAQKAIDAAWTRGDALPVLLKLVGETRSEQYAAQVKALRSDPRAEIKKAADRAAADLGLDKPVPANQPLVATLAYEKLVETLAPQKGDLKNGARLFVRAGCINCHTVTKTESLKGPFLGDIGTRYKRHELIESIVKPSAKIAQGFESQWFQTESGKLYDGFVVRESGDEIEIRTAAGVAQVIPKKEIEERGKRELSIMPQGLVDRLTPADLAALIAYLESLTAAK